MILCSNHRYSSRALLIPFSTPSIGPTSEEESKAFNLLGAAQREAYSAIGWAISLAKKFVEGGETEVSSRISPSVRAILPGVDPRLCTGYACILYFAEKVIVSLKLKSMTTGCVHTVRPRIVQRATVTHFCFDRLLRKRRCHI